MKRVISFILVLCLLVPFGICGAYADDEDRNDETIAAIKEAVSGVLDAYDITEFDIGFSFLDEFEVYLPTVNEVPYPDLFEILVVLDNMSITDPASEDGEEIEFSGRIYSSSDMEYTYYRVSSQQLLNPFASYEMAGLYGYESGSTVPARCLYEGDMDVEQTKYYAVTTPKLTIEMIEQLKKEISDEESYSTYISALAALMYGRDQYKYMGFEVTSQAQTDSYTYTVYGKLHLKDNYDRESYATARVIYTVGEDDGDTEYKAIFKNFVID